MEDIKQRTVTNFFNTNYLEFATATLEDRAIPSIIDSYKPSARKIMYAALSTMKPDYPVKFIDLIGSVFKLAKYEHGDSSLEGGIKTLAAHYANSLAPMNIVGSGGDLRNQNSAAPRYLSVELSKYAKLYLHHSEILEHKYDGDDKLEPTHYLPLIPTVLCKRSSGMALGYSYASAVSYNPLDLTKAVLSIVNEESFDFTNLSPYIEEFKGRFELWDDRVWAEGRFEIHKNKIVVTELPPNQTFSSYEKNLIKLEEAGKIVDWDNNSVDDSIEYVIYVNADQLSKEVSKEQHLKKYCLGEYLKRPTLTFLNEFGKIAQFKSIESVIKYFTRYRLSRYKDYRKYQIKTLTDKINHSSMIKRFIDLYLKNKIKLQKVAIKDVKLQLNEHKIDHSVLTMPISRLTKEEYAKLLDKIAELEVNRKYYQDITDKELYIIDLDEFAKSIKKDFPRSEYKICR